MKSLTGRALGTWGLALLVAGVPRAVLAQDDSPEEEAPAEEAPAEETPPEEEAPVEEVAEEEVTEGDGGLALSQPPPAGKGAIAGIVTDTKYKEPVIEAYVGILGTKTAVLTDVDGTFRLELPPGKYTLRIAYELHKPVRTSEVVVTAGKIVRVDVKLEPEEGTEDVIETVVTLEQSSVEGLLLQRQKSAAAGDSIGRAEITKGNDRTAAEAARRVVGANIEGSRFLFVRGLGERYTNALFDGFPLPSPEPDKQAVPLDLFPSQILESLTIVKTFTPDVPGDFAGGSVRINTRRVPNDLTIAGGLSMGFNTRATFQEVLTYDGGALDWLGIDDGTRALPEEIPGYKVGEFLNKGKSTDLQTPEEVAAYGRAFNTSQSIRTTIAPPNHSGNFVVANSWSLGSVGKVGVLAAIVYDRRFERREDEILRQFVNDSSSTSPLGITAESDLRVDRGLDKVSWGILAGVTLEIGENHRFSLTGLQSQASDNETWFFDGRLETGTPPIADTRKTFIARSLTYGLFQGEHKIPQAGGMTIDYGLSISRASRDEPDRRGVTFTRDPSGYTYEIDGLSGLHFFAEQSERTVGGQLNVTQPIGNETVERLVKVGGAVSTRTRDFDARRFNFRPAGEAYLCPVQDFEASCVDRAFSDVGAYKLEEGTRDKDGYDASLDVFAGYAMFDGEIVDKWRIVLGPRLEASQQVISPYHPVDRNEEKEAIDRREFNKIEVLPAIALIYSPIPRVNLRASLTRTVARPQLRELAPFNFTDFFGARTVQGNPDLRNTSIVNADTRFEFFPKTTEVLAFSAFYKRFEDPIEQFVRPTGSGGTLSWQNALGANLFGVELEGRKSFDVFHPALRPLSLIANVTFAHSSVQLDPASLGEVTSRARALSYQAPYITNLALDFDDQDIGLRARVGYNVVGERIVTVGTNRLPDIYEQPRHVLDVTVGQRIGRHVELRATGSNLLDSPVRRTHTSEIIGDDSESADSNVVQEYFLGQTFSLGVGLNL